MIRFFAWQLLLALDQLVNVLFGGYADETMSSRAYRMSKRHDAGLFGVDVRGALIQADEYANITTGGNKNETWSSRFGRGKLAGRKRYIVIAAIVDFFAFVFAGQKNHCVDAINEQFLESGDAKTNF